MIVEDERIIAEDIRRTLISFGYDVVAMASSGERAIELADEHRPDMILMDIMLEGEMKGTEAAEIIHNTIGTPIIFLTAYADSTTLMNAKRTEPFGYVVKPFEERELNATIEMGLKRYKSELEMKHREEHFRELFESNPAGYQSLDKDGRILEVNSNWLSLLGYEKDEVIGRNFSDFVHDDDKEKQQSVFQGFIRSGSLQDTVLHVIKKDGSVAALSYNGNVQYDSDGHFKSTHCLFTDITGEGEKTQILMESGERYRALFEATTDAILLMDGGRIVECNGHSEKLYHCSKETLLNASVFHFFPSRQPNGEDSKTLAKQYLYLASQGNPQSFEWRHMRYDGTPFDSEVNLKMLTIGGKKYVQAIVHDITQRKRQEAVQKTLYNITNSVHTADSLHELFEQIRHELSTIINTENFYIALYDRTRNMISFPVYADERERYEEVAADESFTGYVIKSGKSLLANRKDIMRLIDNGLCVMQGTIPDIWLGVPLYNEKVPIGLIGVQSYTDPFMYTSQDEEMLQLISGQIATVIARQLANEKLQQRNRQMVKLFEAAKKMATTLDLNEVLSFIGSGAAELLEADRVTNYVLQDDDVTLSPVMAIDPRYKKELLSAPISLDTSLTGKAIIHKRSMIFNDSGTNQESAHVPGMPMRSDERLIVSLLTVEGEIIGAMNITRNGRPFSENELALADTYAAFASNAIRNAEVYLNMQMEMEERRQGEKIQSVLHQISNAVLDTNDIHQLISTIKGILADVIDTTNMFVALYNKDDDTISLPFISDQRDSFNTFPLGRTLTAYTLNSRKPQLLREEQIKELEESGTVDAVGSPSKVWMGIPLIVIDEVIGMVGLQSYENPNQYTEKDVQIMEFVSGQIAAAIQRKQAEEQAKKQSAYIEQLFESSPIAIVLADNDSNVLAVNSEFTRIFGYTFEEAKSVSLDHLLAPSNKVSEATQITEQVRNGERQTFETVRRHKNGSLVDVSIIGTPVFVDDKQVAVFGLYTDITQRKEAEKLLRESEVRFRNLFEESPISIWEQDVSETKQMIDRLIQQEQIDDMQAYLKEHHEVMVDILKSVRVINLNRQTLDLYDALDKDDLKVKYGTIFDAELDDILCQLLTALANDEKEFECVGVNRTLRGEKLHVAMKWTVPNDYSQVLLSVVDITQLKEAEEQRELVIADLKKALQDVKTLSGLIPICASCKKIRNDQGYWTSVEEFIAKHADVDFSHAICPDCLKTQYPKVYERMVREGKITPGE
jgi:PAS domain S-box-containing protein